MIKYCFALGAILLFAACGVQESPGAIPAPTTTPASAEAVPVSPLPTTTTATRSPAPTATINPSATPTLTPTLRPTPADCDAGFVVFSATGDGVDNRDKTGIYLACTDGTFLQQIVSVAEVLPDEDWAITDIAVSLDGRTLAFSAMGKYVSPSMPTPNRLYLVNMRDYNPSQAFSAADIDSISHLSWSPAGDFIAYVAANVQRVYRIEALHVDSQTISTIIGTDTFEYVFANLAWTYDGTRILYTTDTGDNPSIFMAHLANINCDTNTHACSMTDQITLDWMDNNPTYRLSLVPDSLTIVGEYYDSGSDVIEMRDLSGNLITSVNLNEQISTLSYGFYPPSASPDGSRIAFAARVKGGEQRNVFILSLSDKTLTNLTDRLHLAREIDADEVLWIP